ncbi:4-hydroxy-tetrahydrodipicolinate reductase [Candidatus Marinimicrobia bacterium MT.SAG.4]|nr:4-hydroxy-tetrahydrodipicolinate reductase [Candidatus Marinimicrobia bacterium MT.SAG.4]
MQSTVCCANIPLLLNTDGEKVNIGLIGFGRMGKLTSEAAGKRGHNVIRHFNSNDPLISASQIENIECLIDFSVPAAVPAALSIAVEAKVNVVVGTTGWDSNILNDFRDRLESALFCAANFSIGINLFRLILKQATKLLDGAGGYDVMVKEIHHKTKLDSPSGTALNISEDIISQSSSKIKILTDSPHGKVPDDTLQIISERVGDVIGVHEISFESKVDSILFRHQMKDRNAFAVGALAVAEWLKGKSGILDFNDYLMDEFGISKND